MTPRERARLILAGYRVGTTQYADLVLTIEREITAAVAQERAAILNKPELIDFAKAVTIEAQHQLERWRDEHDAQKTAADWLWTLGWLAGKAVHAEDHAKRLHHIVTSGALLANWHAATIRAHQDGTP